MGEHCANLCRCLKSVVPAKYLTTLSGLVPIQLNREAMVEPGDESVEIPHLSFRASHV